MEVWSIEASSMEGIICKKKNIMNPGGWGNEWVLEVHMGYLKCCIREGWDTFVRCKVVRGEWHIDSFLICHLV